jgi:pre-60S factor REI1
MLRKYHSRYNLKRRVTSLPPITSEVFSEKVLAAQASSRDAATRASYEKTCSVCGKTYFSENAYTNHLGSQRHRARLVILRARNDYVDDDSTSVVSSALTEQTVTQAEVESEDDVGAVTQAIGGTSLSDNVDGAPSKEATAQPEDNSPEKEAEVDLKRCLFCNYESPTIALNVTHMERIHSMFIPERQYLVDLDGLIRTLHEKIYEDHECLYCGKLKPTVFGLQTHMRDKGHCKIRFDTEDEQLEIGEHYDFTSTYSDVEDEFSEEEGAGRGRSGGVRLNGKKEKAEGQDGEDDEEGDGWETDSSASSLDSADLTAVPLDQHMHQYERLSRHPHHSHTDPRPHQNRDGYHSHAHKHTHAVFYSDYELHLPSGRSVGHRSLNKYYRQNLHNHPSAAERAEQLAIEDGSDSDSEDGASRRRIVRRDSLDRGRGRAVVSRANGGLGMVGVTDEKKREIRALEKRTRKAEERERRRFQWGVNKGGNSQKHFRVRSIALHSYQHTNSPLGSSSSVVGCTIFGVLCILGAGNGDSWWYRQLDRRVRHGVWYWHVSQ